MAAALVFLFPTLAGIHAATATSSDDNAVLTRMAGSYSARILVMRSEFGGSPPFYTMTSGKLVMPKGRGRMRGMITDPGAKIPLVGTISSAKVRGKKVYYVGKVSLFILLSDFPLQNFRAVASIKGPNREVLTSNLKFAGQSMGVSCVLSASYRGTK